MITRGARRKRRGLLWISEAGCFRLSLTERPDARKFRAEASKDTSNSMLNAVKKTAVSRLIVFLDAQSALSLQPQLLIDFPLQRKVKDLRRRYRRRESQYLRVHF